MEDTMIERQELGWFMSNAAQPGYRWGDDPLSDMTACRVADALIAAGYRPAKGLIAERDAAIAALAAERERGKRLTAALGLVACECTGRCDVKSWLPADNGLCAYRRARDLLDALSESGETPPEPAPVTKGILPGEKQFDWPHDDSYSGRCSCQSQFAGPKRAPSCWNCATDATRAWWRAKFESGETPR
jgi:hypothetical protein